MPPRNPHVAYGGQVNLDDLTDPTSPAGAALGSAFVPLASYGPRIVWLGDSITQGATDNVNQSLGQSYPLMAQLLLGGRGLTVRNAGQAGDTSAQMLARFDTDVAPYAPNVVPILAGTNDVGVGVPLSTYQANVRALVARVQRLGASPVLTTIPPNNDTARRATIVTWNLWLTRYAASIGAPLIDLYGVLVDPATGAFLSGYAPDGTHPSAAAQRLMGQAAANVLAPYFRAWSPPLVRSNGDTVQLLGTNPLLITDGNGDGVPDTWGAYGGSSGFAHALITDPAVPGRMAQITMTAAASIRVLERSIGPAAGWAVGDRLAFAGVVTSDGGVAVDLKLDFSGASKSAFVGRFTGAVTRGVFYGEVTVPTGTTAINVQIIPAAGTGVVAVGQPTLYNLTALGLTSA